jgi:hypothetical protein
MPILSVLGKTTMAVRPLPIVRVSSLSLGIGLCALSGALKKKAPVVPTRAQIKTGAPVRG